MKKIALILASTFMFCCSNISTANKTESVEKCKRINLNYKDENGFSSDEEFTIIVIDSCEYLESTWDRSRNITHKGNCQFCKKRKN